MLACRSAVAFAKKVGVIGFDLNRKKIELYKSGVDPTNEVGNEAIRNTTVEFTDDETKLREAKFHIVAVPTPVNADRRRTWIRSSAQARLSAGTW